MYDSKCTACPLHLRACSVCVPGSGPEHADLLICGMNPGAAEDLSGRPFVGPAGEILNAALSGAGLNRADVFVTNAAKCFSGKAKPSRTELATCTDLYLKREIAHVRPKVIVALGDLALLACANLSGINKNRGQVFPLRPGLQPEGLAPVRVVATFHPAAYLHAGRDERITQALRADLTVAREMLEGRQSGTLEVKEGVPTGEALGFDAETRKDGSFLVGTVADASGTYYLPIHPAGFAEGRRYVAHHAAFDLKVLQQAGFDTPPQVDDTMLMLHLLDSGRKGRYGLEAAVIDEFGVADPEWLAAKRTVHSIGAEMVPRAILEKYCAQDSCYAVRLFERLWPRLQANPQLLTIYEHLTLPTMHMLVRVAQQPVPLDMPYIRALDEEMDARLRVLSSEMAALAGLSEVPNFRSTRALAQVLYKTLGLPLVRVTDTGAPSTDKAVLIELKKFSPFVEKLLVYKRLWKLRSAYTRRWMKRAA